MVLLHPTKHSGFSKYRSHKLDEIEAVTLSNSNLESTEILLHMQENEDLLMDLYLFRNHIMNTLAKIMEIRFQNNLRPARWKVFMVDRTNLKIYKTFTNEKKIGLYRRPGEEYQIDQFMFNDDIVHMQSEMVHALSVVDVEEKFDRSNTYTYTRRLSLRRTILEADAIME